MAVGAGKPAEPSNDRGPNESRGDHREMTWKILKTAIDQWFRHRSARLGAALAYYSVFSMGPLLLIVTSIAGLFFGADAVRGSLTAQFRPLQL
jgi:membrane protein